MDNIKPLLLIDVDGVLNPLCSRDSVPPGFELFNLIGFPVLLSRQHGAWLNALADSYELAWATTWEHQANEMVGPLIGLPQLPFIKFDWDHDAPTRKLRSVKRYVGERRAAWIDDDLWDDAHEWAEAGDRILLLDIDPLTGLTQDHIDTLTAWAK